MVIKNSLKSESIESLSYKLNSMNTNIYTSFSSMLNNLYSFDGEPSGSSSKITLENSSFKLSITGSNLLNDDTTIKITSVKYQDKISDLGIEVKGSFDVNTLKFTSASISDVIDGEKITLKQTFENFTINLYDYYNIYLEGVKWSIIDDKGGILEIDAGDISLDEYTSFDSLSLENIILNVDPNYDFSQNVVTHPDMKFAVMDDSNNIIKITTNNSSEFEVDSNGNIIINGLGGNDKISATSGNDHIDGGAGADIMNGGMGDDTYIVDNIKDMVKESALQGEDSIIFANLEEFSLAKLANVENLTYDGSDYAGLIGNKLNNILIGGDGENDLFGGLGNDTLTGGEGLDWFWFNTKLGSANVDTITDFVSGEDIIVLTPKLFKNLAKNFTEDNFITGSSAEDSNDYVIFNNENDTLYYDTDGSGTKASAQAICIVGTNTTITFSDIDITNP